MTHVVRATGASMAPPAAFFACWADMVSWPEWNTDTEWVRLDGPFRQGATGRLKPKGAPAVRFTVSRLVPDREFVDVSALPGARLTFSHLLGRTTDGRTTIQVDVTITGPLRWLWSRLMGEGLRRSAQPDVDGLIARAEQDAPSEVGR